jgi:hypothetical protein
VTGSALVPRVPSHSRHTPAKNMSGRVTSYRLSVTCTES